MKKFWMLLALLALATAIVACGGSEPAAEIVDEAAEVVEDAVETVEETVEEVAEEAEEAMEEAEEAVEEAAEEMMEEVDMTDWPDEFVIGVFGGDDAEAALEGGEPLRDYLAAELGIPVTAITGTSYSAVIEAMRAGRVDAMQVGPFSFVLAEREAGAIPIATIVNESRDLAEFSEDVFPYYFSVFVTKKGSGIATLEDLEGVDFAFVDPASTSGRNAPAVRLINEIDGLETPADVDEWMETIFAGSHPSAITALWNDKVSAAATYEGNLINLREEGAAEVCGYDEGRVGIQLSQEEINAIYEACPDGSLVIIAQSDPIPNTPFAISPDLPESFRDAVQAALLKTADTPEFISEFGSWYVDPSETLNINNVSEFYDVVRDIARVTIDEEGAEETNAVTECPVGRSGEYTGISAEGANIEWWVNHSGGRLEGLEEIIADFNAENGCGITVTANNIGGYGDISRAFNGSVAAGEVTAALIVGYQNDQATYQLNEALVDINLLIEDEGVGLSDGQVGAFYQSFFNQSVHPLFDNQRLGFAPNRSIELLHYNKTYAEELGFDGPPTTPDEFVEMACAAAQASESGVGGFVLRTDASAVAAWTLAYGGELLTEDGSEYVYNSQATIDALSMVQELATPGEDGLICGYFLEEGFPNPEVASRNALFGMGSSSGIPFYVGDFASFNEENGTSDEYAIAAIPHTTAEPVMNVYGGDVMIAKTTPEEELAAWEFVKWFTAPENQARWVEVSNYFPTNSGTVDFIDEYVDANPVYAQALDLLQYGKFEPQLPSYFPVRGQAEEAFNAILQGADVVDTLDTLTETANELQEEVMAEIEG